MTSGYTDPDDDPLGEFLARFFGGAPGAGTGGGAGEPPPRSTPDRHRPPAQPTGQGPRPRRGPVRRGTRQPRPGHPAPPPRRPRRGADPRPPHPRGRGPDSLAAEIDERSGPAHAPDGASLALTPAVKRALLDAHDLARAGGTGYIGPEHVLGALAANPDSAAGHILNAARYAPTGLPPESPDGVQATRTDGPRPGTTPTLDKYSRDLTDLARHGRIDPVIGRDEEIEQTIEVLSRRGKNNPVLIGDAGVGKTAIVEGLAQRITDGDVPDVLTGRRVVALDLTGVVAGTRFRGDFEERLTNIVGEIRAHSDELIVFIDELHTVVGAGGGGEGGSMDAGNILKPALARGELHIVGATTLEEYRRIEKDAALARRFQPILVPEPSVADAIEILRGLRDRYEAHHQVRYTDEALVAAVELSDRYLTDRRLPTRRST